jgi:small subunit ribosomal protein S9
MEKKEVKTKAIAKTKVATEKKVVVKEKINTEEKAVSKPAVNVEKKVASTTPAVNTAEKVVVKAKKTAAKSDVQKIYATGKRKTAVAKVWMMKGTGKIIINNRELTDYFQRPVYKMVINQPFALIKAEDEYDVECQVLGSGLSGQASAIKHGISKALSQISEELRQTLRSGGFLTRDSRRVERKKYGQPKARKKFQFSKR